MPIKSDPTPDSNPRTNTLRRVALIALEVFLILLIIGLLCAMWLPAYIGAPPDPTPN